MEVNLNGSSKVLDLDPVPSVPSVNIGSIKQNSAVINFSYSSPISLLGYKITVIDQKTGQTIVDEHTTSRVNWNTSGGATLDYFEGLWKNQYGKNFPDGKLSIQLKSGNNYKVYVMAVNKKGNSKEVVKSFKTASDSKGGAGKAREEHRQFSVIDKESSSVIPLSTGKKDSVFSSSDSTIPFISVSETLEKVIPSLPEASAEEDSTLNSVKIRISFTNTNISDFTTSISPFTIGDLQYDSNAQDEWKYTLLSDIINTKPLLTLSELINVINQKLQEFKPSKIDKSVGENMVSLSLGTFTLDKGEVKGEIIFIAQKSFNPYYYNPSFNPELSKVISMVQIKEYPSGIVNKIKMNKLNFSEKERDETISIKEKISGDVDAVIIECLVTDLSGGQAFAVKRTQQIICKECDQGKECPIGQHRDFNGKCVSNNPENSILTKFMGATAILGALALLGSKSR
jgi:hypothetical protein